MDLKRTNAPEPLHPSNHPPLNTQTKYLSIVMNMIEFNGLM